MLTVGLSHDLVISSVAIVRDGQVIAAIPEERLNRQKAFKGFPTLALKECLRQAGAQLSDVDCIAQGWNPMRHLEFPNFRQSNSARFRGEYLYGIPNMLKGVGALPNGEWIEQSLDGFKSKIRYYDHQLTHAANAFYLSRFDQAAVFSADGRGEIETCYLGHADAQGFHKLSNVLFPHSLGLLYGAVTQFLGYRPDSDEWKVMAMASYGSADTPFYKLLRPMVDTESCPGQFFIDQRYVSPGTTEAQEGKLYTREFVKVFGPPRARHEEMDARHMDIARALQRVFEESMSSLLVHLHAETGERRLAAAGGCLMNSVYNGKISQTTPFEEVFISSCPDDSGICIGAALLAYHELSGGGGKRHAHPHNYWGPNYDDQVEKTLAAYKLPLLKLSDPAKAAAELIANGHLIGWCQGRMEFGQRALGNRSILADPRSEDAKDIVNAAVKYREGFRPFAPAILSDRVPEYFEAPDDAAVPFMERVYQFRPEKRALVPAVVHADGSGRLQTVERENNARFYDLIAHFDKLTGVPIVLNTSFNLNGEPIVCTPTDALRTFFSCGLDELIVGDYIVTKRPNALVDKWLAKQSTAR